MAYFPSCQISVTRLQDTAEGKELVRHDRERLSNEFEIHKAPVKNYHCKAICKSSDNSITVVFKLSVITDGYGRDVEVVRKCITDNLSKDDRKMVDDMLPRIVRPILNFVSPVLAKKYPETPEMKTKIEFDNAVYV